MPITRPSSVGAHGKPREHAGALSIQVVLFLLVAGHRGIPRPSADIR